MMILSNVINYYSYFISVYILLVHFTFRYFFLLSLTSFQRQRPDSCNVKNKNEARAIYTFLKIIFQLNKRVFLLFNMYLYGYHIIE